MHKDCLEEAIALMPPAVSYLPGAVGEYGVVLFRVVRTVPRTQQLTATYVVLI